MHSSDEKICCGRLRMADKKSSTHRLPISDRIHLFVVNSRMCCKSLMRLGYCGVCRQPSTGEERYANKKASNTENFTTKINSKQLSVQCLTVFYGWVLLTCMHRGSPDSARRHDGASLKLIEFAQRHKNYLFSRFAPRGQSRQKTQSVQWSPFGLLWLSFFLEWMFFNTTCFRSGVKVVTWPEEAQRLGKKTMIDSIVRRCAPNGRREAAEQFNSFRVVEWWEKIEREGRKDGNWGFHLIYLCRRMVIHLNWYSQPIAFFSFVRQSSLECAFVGCGIGECRFDFNLFIPFLPLSLSTSSRTR